jgi:hypothetical protein
VKPGFVTLGLVATGVIGMGSRTRRMRLRILARSASILTCAVLAAGLTAAPAVAQHGDQRETPAWLMSRVTSAQPWASMVRNTLAEWYLADGGSKLVIGLTRTTPAVRSAARAAFGGAADLIVVPRPMSAVGAGVVPGVVHIPAPAATASGPGDRRAEKSPFYGGGEIISYHKVSASQYDVVFCTSSWDSLGTVSKLNVMITAGHCDASHTWKTWYSGYLADGVVHIGAKEGSVAVQVFKKDKSDAMTITLSAASGTYAPRIFTGTATSSASIPVTGSAAISAKSVGELICTDGVIAGAQVCGPKIISVNLCVQITDSTAGITEDVCHLALARYKKPFCTPGNSGGPVYRDVAGVKSATALGTIDGYASSGSKYYCYINQLPAVLAAVHATLIKS